MSVRIASIGVVTLTLLSARAAAQEPKLRFTGETKGDNFGWSVAPAGDVNGDGIADILVGAPSHASVAGFAGRSYLFYGPFVAPRTAAQADAILSATTFGDNLGIAVSSAGDLNSDGLDDVLIGARGNDAAGIQAGRVYLFNGPLDGALDDTQATAILFGEEFDELGHEVSQGGDLNGDGIDDILLGAPLANSVAVSAGSAHVFYGPLTGVHSTTTADATVLGTEFNEQLGESLAVGDLDNDGQDDLVVGGSRPPLNGSGPGRVYVVFGPVSGTQSASAADVILVGEQANDEFGSSVSVGDVNGDSIADLVIGADQFFVNGAAGKAYLFCGPLAPGSISGSQADAILLGEAGDDAFGAAVSSGADLNGDGIGEVVVGAPGFGPGDILSGRAYVLFGPLTGTIPAGNADLILTGDSLDELGHSVSMAPSLQTDGSDGLLIGGPAHPNSNSAGIVRLLQPSDPFSEFCFGDGSGIACPCGNTGLPGRGCENSSSTGGAVLAGSGQARLSADTLVLTSSGERPTSFTLFWQARSGPARVFGDGVGCLGSSRKRMYARNAVGGVVSAPQGADPSVSARSAALGDPIGAGEVRVYHVFYRDPDPTFCAPPTGSTFNVSSGLQVLWSE